jgi:hypothetical protein
LLLVPLLSVPLLKLNVHLTWKLPLGRNPMHHHIFPLVKRGSQSEGILNSPSEDVHRQMPLYAGDYMGAEGLSVGLDFSLTSGGEKWA